MPRFKVSARFVCHDVRYVDSAEAEVVLDLPPGKEAADALMYAVAEEKVRQREHIKETYPVDISEVTVTSVE